MPGRAGRADNERLKRDNNMVAIDRCFMFKMTIQIELAYLGNFYEISKFIKTSIIDATFCNKIASISQV